MYSNSGPWLIVVAVAAIIVVWALYRLGQWSNKRGGLLATIFEWEHALLYENGKFVNVLPPGRYVRWSPFGRRDIFTVRNTEQLEPSAPADVTSKDGLVFRMSAMVGYRVVEPRIAHQEGYLEKIRFTASTAVVKLAAAHNLQQLLSDRAAMDAELKTLFEPKIYGCEITSAAIHTITLPPEVRRLIAEIERAKLEGLAALERARGENAALRTLANAASVLKGNPELMNLQILQAMSSSSGRNQLTLVLGKEGLVSTAEGGTRG